MDAKSGHLYILRNLLYFLYVQFLDIFLFLFPTLVSIKRLGRESLEGGTEPRISHWKEIGGRHQNQEACMYLGQDEGQKHGRFVPSTPPV